MVSSFAIEPDVPRDPLAAAENAQWAVQRHLAVVGVPLEPRAVGLLAALASLDAVLDQLALAVPTDLAATLDLQAPAAIEQSQLTDRSSAEERVTQQMPALGHQSLTEAARAAVAEADRRHASAAPSPSAAPQTAEDDGAIELSPDEVDDAETIDVAEAFVRAGSRERRERAEAQTIVLSGPDIKRKIRHKQSVMPAFMGQTLYEDIGALFEIGDREGALISLERLLAIAPITPQVEEFLGHNEGRLLEYYESVLGPWQRSGRTRLGEQGMPQGYFKVEKIAIVTALLDGRSLQAVIDQAGLRPIETCAILSQLFRSSSLELSDK